MLRDVRWAAATWAAAAWLAWPLAVQTTSFDAAARNDAQDARAFKVVTLNAWFRNRDTRRVAHYIAVSQADVVFVQEFDAARMRELTRALPTGIHAAFVANLDRHGAAVLSRWPIEAARPLHLAGTSRYAQWALVRWRDKQVQVVAVHLPWPLGPQSTRERDAQLNALAEWMSRSTQPVIVGGDFNQTPWSPRFSKAVAAAHARDALATHPAMYTWPTSFPLLGIQIDHCLISPQWQVARTGRGPRIGSDHFPVELELRLDADAIPRARVAG